MGVSYISNIFVNTKGVSITPFNNKHVSSVYDNQNNIVTKLDKEKTPYVSYEDL